MDNFMDIFNDDAFNLTSMVAAINNIDYVPGRAGQLCFAGVGEGINTRSVVIESRHQALSLVQTSAVGGPAPQEKEDKATIRKVANIPQVKLEETISASRLQGVREFGSTNVLVGAQGVINRQMQKIASRLDLTLEHHRLGALKGYVRDADGSILLDLYTAFGIDVPDAFDWSFLLNNAAPTSGAESAAEDEGTVRAACQKVTRYMKRNAKMVLPSGWQVWAFCGDEFFDKLIHHWSVREVFKNWQAATRLSDNLAFDVFPFGGINFENYQGTDDVAGDETSEDLLTDGKVGIAADEARFFITGVPGLYEEYFAPADFFDTVNTIGLPRYARLAVDQEMQRFVKMHVQQNPLPLCTRPQTLVRGVL